MPRPHTTKVGPQSTELSMARLESRQPEIPSRLGGIMATPPVDIGAAIDDAYVISAASLDKLAEIASTAHQELIQQTFRAGLALIAAKNKLPEGEWIMWVKNHVGYSVRTAQRYMQLAEVLPELWRRAVAADTCDTVSHGTVSKLILEARTVGILDSPRRRSSDSQNDSSQADSNRDQTSSEPEETVVEYEEVTSEHDGLAEWKAEAEQAHRELEDATNRAVAAEDKVAQLEISLAESVENARRVSGLIDQAQERLEKAATIFKAVKDELLGAQKDAVSVAAYRAYVSRAIDLLEGKAK